MSSKKPPEEKIGSIAPFGLRMLPELKQRIEEAAANSGRSMNAEIVARLEQSFLSKVHADGTNEVSMSKGEYRELMSRLDRIGSLLGDDPMPLSPEAQAAEAELRKK